MARKFGFILCILCTLVLFFGLISYATTGTFGIDYQSFVDKFTHAPNFNDLVSYKDSIAMPFQEFTQAIIEVKDFFSFFTAVGAFFSSIGKAVVWGFNLVTLPVRYLVWFISILFPSAS